MRKNVVKDRKVIARFVRRFDYCMACGIPKYKAPWPGVSCHHIVKQGRSDEETNLALFCCRCHQLAENLQVAEGGVRLPTMPLGVCLTLKMVRDPGVIDLVRLRELRGVNLPEMRPVPDLIEDEYRRWRPWDVLRFYRHKPAEVT